MQSTVWEFKVKYRLNAGDERWKYAISRWSEKLAHLDNTTGLQKISSHQNILVNMAIFDCLNDPTFRLNGQQIVFNHHINESRSFFSAKKRTSSFKFMLTWMQMCWKKFTKNKTQLIGQAVYLVSKYKPKYAEYMRNILRLKTKCNTFYVYLSWIHYDSTL